MKICCKCWNRQCSCGNKNLVEIDNLIVDDIIALNKKGYKSLFCCEGHRYCGIFHLYVVVLKQPPRNKIPYPLKLKKFRDGTFIVEYYKRNNVITVKEIELAREAFHKFANDLDSLR